MSGMENMSFNGLVIQMGSFALDWVRRPPMATGPGSERQSWGWSPCPCPWTSVPFPLLCPSQHPDFPSSLLLLEPKLTSLLLQLCFLKPLFENSFPCQEPQALWSCEIKPDRTRKKHCLQRSQGGWPSLGHGGKPQAHRTLTLPTPPAPRPPSKHSHTEPWKRVCSGQDRSLEVIQA